MACKTDGGGIPGSVPKSTGFTNCNWSDVHKKEKRVQVPYLAPPNNTIFNNTPWAESKDNDIGVKKALEDNSIHVKNENLAYKNNMQNDNNNGGIYT